MNSEYYELWDAMKDSVYAKTGEKLSKIIRGSNGELLPIMDTVLCTVATAMHTAVGTLWYMDGVKDNLIRPEAVYGGGDLSGVVLLPGEGIAGKVIQDNKPTVIMDCQKDPRWAGEVANGSTFITKTMLCVPLAFEEKAYGCIQLINKTDDTFFDDRDFDMAMKLASLVSEEFNKYNAVNRERRQVNGVIKSLEVLDTCEPAILRKALEQMQGYSKAGKIAKMSILWHLREFLRSVK